MKTYTKRVSGCGLVQEVSDRFNRPAEEADGAPADPFVHELLGADDMVRQLGLLTVNSAMMALPDNYQNGSKPTVNAVDNLRDALSLILKTGAPELSVVDQDKPVGLLTLEHIRSDAAEANR